MAGVAERLSGPLKARILEGVREALRYALAPVVVAFGVCALAPLTAAALRALAPASAGPHAVGGVYALIAAANIVQRALWALAGGLFLLAGVEIGRAPYRGGISLLATALTVGAATWSTFVRSPATAALAPGLFMTAAPLALVFVSLGLWLLILTAPAPGDGGGSD